MTPHLQLSNRANIIFKIEWSRGSKCHQYEVYEDKDWLTNLEKGLELQPRYIYFGEMITPEATARVSELASDGNHLVISTVTADTIEHALMRVYVI